jgi:hypothetical protein
VLRTAGRFLPWNLGSATRSRSVAGSRSVTGLLSSRELRPFLAALIAGVCARWLYVLTTAHFRPVHDDLGYLLRAQYLASHYALMPIIGPDHRHYADAYWPPLFPAVLAALTKLHAAGVAVGIARPAGLITWLRLAMSTLNAVSLVALTVLAFRLWGRRTALATAWIGALYLPWIDVGASLYSESLSVPLVIALSLATLEYRHTGRRLTLVVAGSLAGLATMTHGNGVVLIPAVCAAVWTAGGRPARSSTAGGMRRAVAVIAVSGAVIAPWTVRNAIELHAFVPLATSLGNTLAGTYNARSAGNSPPARWLIPSHRVEYRAIYRSHPTPGPAQDAALRDRALRYIEGHPRYLLTAGVWDTANLLGLTYLDHSLTDARREHVPLWSVRAQQGAFWVLGGLAILGCLTQRARQAPRWLWAIPILLFLSVVWVGAASPLYRAPVDPFLIILAACACDAASRRGALPGRPLLLRRRGFKRFCAHPLLHRFGLGDGRRPRCSRSVAPVYSSRKLPRSWSRGTTSSTKRSNPPGVM